ncbi:MAG: ABC transporter ATP-binding protein/permease [Clostridiales bacterium]|jgi:putative ABC transport system permease protein|nr:ABC transporter ATP-binding protein/permease [Clostridiales bacterium]
MLRVKNLVKTYESDEYRVEALRDISLCFRKNEFVSILGPSGCGKTTLLNIIGGLDRYTSGNVTISGISTKHFSDKHWDAYRNNSVGFVFQSYNLIPHLSILDNVALTLSLTGINKSERIKRSKDVLDKVGLSDQYNKLPSQLSGGQMQRVAIARALINKPDVILADEPTGALDSELSIQVMEILKEVSKDTLVIMVTHNETLAKTYSTRIIRMLDGQIVDDSNEFSELDAISNDVIEIEKLNVLPSEKNQLFKMLLKEIDRVDDKQGIKVETSELCNELNLKINALIVENNALITKSLKSKPKFLQNFQKKKKAKKTVVVPFKATSMQYKTAIALSLKNLNSKRRRTILTTFAGSIGIISLALVLALSWGYQKYLERMQKNVLASVPVSIYEYTMAYSDFTKMFDGIEGASETQTEYDGSIYIENKKETGSELLDLVGGIMNSFGQNNLSEEYLAYIEKMDKSLYDSITIIRGNQFNLITKTKDDEGNDEYIDVSKTPAVTEMFNIGTTVMGEQGLQINNWHQLVGSQKYMESYYNVVEGRYPTNKNEIVLVINDKNKVNLAAFKEFGLDVYERDNEGKIIYNESNPDEPNVIESLTFHNNLEEVFSKMGTIKLINNNNYYFEHDETPGLYATIKNLEKSDPKYSIQQNKLKDVFENASNLELKIVGILKPNPNNPTMGSIVGNHLCYTADLAEYVYKQAITSSVAQAQITAIQKDDSAVLPATKPVEGNPSQYKYSEFTSVIRYQIIGDEYEELSPTAIKFKDGSPVPIIGNGLESIAELQRIGAIKNPKYISIYAKNFETKNKIIEYLEKYNENKETRDQVKHFDMSEMFIQNIRTVMNLMTIVLLALASISLIVSSIMIGIITGNSVYERTREIGMMRALGARKQDIARVFNTETALIGFFSGLLGIVIPYIVIPFINIGLKVRFNVSNILILNPLHAFILLLLSMLLTFVAGIIPSQIAAKRDIVRSIRIE